MPQWYNVVCTKLHPMQTAPAVPTILTIDQSFAIMLSSWDAYRCLTATQCWCLMCTNVVVFVEVDCLSSSFAFRQGWTLCFHFELSDFQILKMAHSSSTTYSNFLWSLGKSKQNPNCQCSNAATCKTWAQLPKFWFKFEKFGTGKKLSSLWYFKVSSLKSLARGKN